MKRLCLACFLSVLAAAATAFAAPRPAAAPPTTQKATVSPTAFEPNDPDVTPELAKAVEPKRVTLKVQNMPAINAMQELAKQTGYDIRPAYEQWFTGRNRGNNVTLDLSYQPFWVVAREICTRGNITLYNSGDQGKSVQLAPGNYNLNAMRPATSIRGPFLVIVSHLQRINDVQMSAPQTVNRNVQIQLNVFIEPGVSVSEVSYRPVIEEAADNHGNSMVPPNQDESGRHMQGSRGIAWHGNVSLPYPTSNPGQRIARVKGHIPATLHLASEPVEIADPLNASETAKTAGKRKVTFNSLKKEGESNYVLELTFHKDPDDTRQMHEMFNETIDMKLTDAQGRVWRYHNSGGHGKPDAVTRRFSFQPPRDATGPQATPQPNFTKLVIAIPTGRQEIAIPFELVDLPLP